MSIAQALPALRDRLGGAALVPGDDGFARECATFNTLVVHAPDVVVVPRDAAGVAAAVRVARQHGLAVHVQSTGHGAHAPIRGGLLVATRGLDAVSVDPDAQVATIGAGARAGAVIAAAAPHGLMPVLGASTTVGVVGYLLGGGLGPLARSHGFSSDFVDSFAIVDGRGELREASGAENTELFFALRGGGPGLGVVTSLRLRLVPLRTLYAGALYFDEAAIAPALRGWLAWTATADPRVSTSAGIIHYPPLEVVPPPLRGKKMLALRFAFPGAAAEGARLAAPLRALAAPVIDAVREMPTSDIGQIHNDPTEPGPSWVRGALLARADAALGEILLGHFGAGTRPPFIAVELRHLGEATRSDVPDGSAVSGRGAAFTLALIGRDPALFAEVIPAAMARLKEELAPWISPERNLNFLGSSRSAEDFAGAWPPATRARLDAVRAEVDPQRIFARG